MFKIQQTYQLPKPQSPNALINRISSAAVQLASNNVNSFFWKGKLFLIILVTVMILRNIFTYYEFMCTTLHIHKYI